ncbi:2-amino-4-hydroxy-6-hydroxymethyldihydropteridinepyrophosphokinase [hydrothermal vent metagenome]|uniref:2-amino-4-hydroxy-6-hydroxymethyldihydropteridine diphosphokinase n=1 Tax=hydrothermal vent metagenome TaxID=652676 RepID=A0A3B0YSC3_9ZZZZ
MTEVIAYIGLGSNLDNPQAQVNRALTELDNLQGCRLCQASSLYASPPMGPADQPDYINAVAEIGTQLTAESLLEQLQILEAKHDRKPTHRWGPRTLDLDLLLYGDAVIETHQLSVPHPGVSKRPFVLYPLAELNSRLMVPGAGRVESLLLDCPRASLMKIFGPTNARYSRGQGIGLKMENPGFIVVEGPIGVGKTSLAKRLAETFGSELLLEGAADNPFLERFYRNPRAAAMQTQLFFLLQRTQQMQELRQSDMFEPVRVSDFLMDKDALFAELTLDREELKLYQQVYSHLTTDMPKPDLVVYLQAPVDVLLKRIGKRGVAYERSMEPAYLRSLCDAYTRFFHYYDEAPLLIVNAAEINLVDSDSDYESLLEQMALTTSGRRYFNPMPGTLITTAGGTA